MLSDRGDQWFHYSFRVEYWWYDEWWITMMRDDDLIQYWWCIHRMMIVPVLHSISLHCTGLARTVATNDMQKMSEDEISLNANIFRWRILSLGLNFEVVQNIEGEQNDDGLVLTSAYFFQGISTTFTVKIQFFCIQVLSHSTNQIPSIWHSVLLNKGYLLV